jgi:hypothetical protein
MSRIWQAILVAGLAVWAANLLHIAGVYKWAVRIITG